MIHIIDFPFYLLYIKNITCWLVITFISKNYIYNLWYAYVLFIYIIVVNSLSYILNDENVSLPWLVWCRYNLGGLWIRRSLQICQTRHCIMAGSQCGLSWISCTVRREFHEISWNSRRPKHEICVAESSRRLKPMETDCPRRREFHDLRIAGHEIHDTPGFQWTREIHDNGDRHEIHVSVKFATIAFPAKKY